MLESLFIDSHDAPFARTLLEWATHLWCQVSPGSSLTLENWRVKESRPVCLSCNLILTKRALFPHAVWYILAVFIEVHPSDKHRQYRENIRGTRLRHQAQHEERGERVTWMESGLVMPELECTLEESEKVFS